MPPDYRVSLRNLINKRRDLAELSVREGLDPSSLEDLVERRLHVPIEVLLRLIEEAGGELLVRPEVVPHLARAEDLKTFAALFPLSPLPTRGVAVHRRYGAAIEMEGPSDLSELAAFVIESSVPYIACQKKCIASSFCPLAMSRTPWGPADEERCGIMANSIATFILAVGTALKVKSKVRLQALVDAARLYGDASFAAMQLQAFALSPAVVRWHGDALTRSMHATMLHLSAVGQSTVEAWSRLGKESPPFVWLFEGKSERLFFSKLLRSTHAEAFVPSRAIDLGGVGSLKHVKLLLRQKRSEGMEPLLLVDATTRTDDTRVESLVREKLVLRRNVLRFRKDFESSFPAAYLGRVYSTLIDAAHKRELGEALAKYRLKGSSGFTVELKRALNQGGMTWAAAQNYVDAVKTRAARHMAADLRPHLADILSSTTRTPEIEGVIRRVVADTRDYEASRTAAWRKGRKQREQEKSVAH